MRQEKKMAAIRSAFSAQSGEYDAQVAMIIPRYEEMLDVLVSCFSPLKGKRIRAIDLGCGTGAVSRRLLDSFPGMELTCLDMAEGMLDMARQRLAGRDDVRFVLADLYEFEFDGPYDVVISSLALHHIVTDEDKKALYRRIYDALLPGGSFYNADIVLGSDEQTQALYMGRWRAFMNQNFSGDEVDNALIPRYYREDSPARLLDHMCWLDEVGFRDVDVVWKNNNFAVYGGRRCGSPKDDSA
jgi:tRNA (cmo5U34)-methyltransferase